MFEQVIGQHDVQQRLMQLVSEERLPHALMLCGPQGCGKKALAIGFAKVLLTANGQKPSAMVDKLEHPDLHFTYPTIKLPSMGADHKPVSDDFAAQWHDMVMGGYYFNMTDWLEQMGGENQQAIITAGESDALIRKLSLKSSQGGYKVSIIWLPERMNIECANKILKLLEEPPSQTVFIMVCEEPEKLLETIRSRVQRIDVKRIDTDSICQALKLTADTENELFLDLFQALMRLAYQRKIKELKQWSEQLASMGRERQKRFLTYFLRLIRENFMYNFQEGDLCYMSQREEEFARNFARFINEANILPITELADRAIRDIGQNANAKIVFFDMALQMIVLLIQK